MRITRIETVTFSSRYPGPARTIEARREGQVPHCPCTLFGSLDNKSERPYLFNMVIESIREFNRSVPFVPYEVRMNGGETYRVPHPDFISISPRGSFIVIIDKRDRPHHLNALLIERVSRLNGRLPRKASRISGPRRRV
jgi:hypothetical protein